MSEPISASQVKRTLHSLDLLDTVTDREIVKIQGVMLILKSDFVYMQDVSGSNRTRVYSASLELVNSVRSARNSELFNRSIYVRCEEIGKGDFYYAMRSDKEFHHMPNVANTCTCGATYTSFPGLHSHWCDYK